MLAVLEMLFRCVCGWVGHWIVKLITFGKTEMPWGDESGAELTEAIGLLFILMATAVIVWLVR